MTDAVLIVDDWGDDAKLLELILKKLGVTNPIHTISSAVEAIAYVQGDFPYSDRTKYPKARIVLLDLKLPGMDGFDFLKWLEAGGRAKDVIVFVVSGFNDLASIRRAYSMGARSFLVKPCLPQDVENLLLMFPEHWSRTVAPLS